MGRLRGGEVVGVVAVAVVVVIVAGRRTYSCLLTLPFVAAVESWTADSDDMSRQL